MPTQRRLSSWRDRGKSAVTTKPAWGRYDLLDHSWTALRRVQKLVHWRSEAPSSVGSGPLVVFVKGGLVALVVSLYLAVRG